MKTSFFQSLKFQSLKKDIQLSFFLAGGIFLVLFLSISTFAALTKNTPAAEGGLTGGAFMYWTEEILLPSTLPEEKNIFQVAQKIEHPTVKKARKLANADGSQVAIGKDGKVGIGTDTPRQLLEISGDTPRLLVSSVAENPEIQLVASGKKGKIYFDRNAENIVFEQNKKKSLTINQAGEANASRTVKEKFLDPITEQEREIIVVHGNQKCQSGMFVSGFDEQGGILCR